MQIRDATPGDIAAVQAIYAHHVLHGLGTFETAPPGVEEMQRRYAQITGDGFPYLVAEEPGRMLGYAYANHFRTRAAYRNTVEDSIYVAADAMGRGVGTGLLDRADRTLHGARTAPDAGRDRRLRRTPVRSACTAAAASSTRA